MHEIVGADAVIDGKARSISGVRVLGRYRLQIRLTRPLGDFTARLTMPFFCPILPNTPIDPAGIDDPPGSGPYYVAERIVEPADRAAAKPVLPRRPAGERRPDRLDDRESRRGLRCRDRAGPDRPAAPPRHPPRRTGGSPTVRHQPAGRAVLRRPTLSTWYFAFNHDRPAFRGRGQIPLKKAINYAIDRPALARAFGYLAGRRTDQMLPPALGATRASTRSGGRPGDGAEVARARRSSRPTLVLYASNSGIGVALAQVLAFNLKQIGIDLDVKYFDTDASARGPSTGRAVRPRPQRLGSRLRRPGGVLRPRCSIPKAGRHQLRTSTTARRTRGSRRRTGCRRGAAQGLGRPRRRPDARRPTLGAVRHRTRRVFVSRSFGCVVLHPVYGVDLAAACKK